MPRNWYRCPVCDTHVLLTYPASIVGTDGWPPVCGACHNSGVPGGSVLELAPRPGDFALDLKTDGEGDRSFQKFTVDVDGTPTLIDSLHKLRQVERESEQRYRNGEGEPLRFRMYAQEGSNRDVNTFGTAGAIGDQTYSSGQPPSKSGKVRVQRHGEEAPDRAAGPGLTAPTSPL